MRHLVATAQKLILRNSWVIGKGGRVMSFYYEQTGFASIHLDDDGTVACYALIKSSSDCRACWKSHEITAEAEVDKLYK